jgi:hypothetical protein
MGVAKFASVVLTIDAIPIVEVVAIKTAVIVSD